MANHSCIPNAAVQFIGRNTLLIAENPIRAGDEIELAYTCKKDARPMSNLPPCFFFFYELTIV